MKLLAAETKVEWQATIGNFEQARIELVIELKGNPYYILRKKNDYGQYFFYLVPAHAVKEV